MARVLVTGAAGFLGSHVADELLKVGHQVIGLDDLSGGLSRNVPEGIEFVRGSILDAPLLAKLFQIHRFEYVFHLAAYAAEGLSHFIRRFNYTNNVVGSVNLINEAVNGECRCFVFSSSIAVYGPGQTPMREDMTPTPEDPYGVAKYAVELDLHAANRMFELPSIIFRPHNVYGERQNLGDRYRNVIGIFMNQAMQGVPMGLFGDGSQTRAFSYVGDVAPLIAQSIDIPSAYNETFNVGSDEPTTVADLATMVSEAMGVPRQVIHREARNEVLHAFADHGKLARVFDYRARWSLRDGLERMANWALSVGPSESSTFGEIEILKKLPASWKA
jgi:UDP-glucose 4-epimerase